MAAERGSARHRKPVRYDTLTFSQRFSRDMDHKPSLRRTSRNTNLTQSSDIWFEDGTVVLEADCILFRVFSGILAQNSTVFRDMFSLPQPTIGEAHDGCPLVHLSDRAEDLSFFLRAMHDASFYDIQHVNEFAVVSGVLRLSTKFEVLYLRNRSISWLRARYPSTLEAWDDNYANPKPITPFELEGRKFEVVKLAHECNLPILLPASLYACCTNMAKLLDGVKARDGVSQLGLDWEDKRRCLLGRSRIEVRFRSMMFHFLNTTPSPESCRSVAKCCEAKIKYSSVLESNILNSPTSSLNPLRVQLFPWKTFEKAVCGFCYDDARTSYDDGREMLWDMLPALFDLGTWKDLENVMERY